MNVLEKTERNVISVPVATRPRTFTELKGEQHTHITVTRSSSCERGYNYRWRKARIAYLIEIAVLSALPKAVVRAGSYC